MKVAVAVIVAVAIGVIAAGVFVRMRAQPRTAPSYEKVGETLIQSNGNPAAGKSSAPVRPAGLDIRLDREVAVKLRSLGAPTKENWKEVHACYYQVLGSIIAELQAIDPDNDWFERLSPGRRAVVLAENLEREVSNGGFDQFYLNSSGDGAAFTPDAMRLLGASKIAAIVERANAQFPGGPPISRDDRIDKMRELREKARDVWNALDNEYYDLPTPYGGFAVASSLAYVLAHDDEFFRDK